METMSIEQFIAKYTCPAPPPSPFDDPNYGSFEQPTSPSFSASAAPSMFSQSPMARPGMPANYGAEMTLVPANQSMHGGAAPFQAGGGSGPVTQIRLVSKDPQFFPTLIRDLNKSVKVGRLMEPSNETDPTFIPYNTKVVSRVHAEIWEANGAPLSLSPLLFLASLSFVLGRFVYTQFFLLPAGEVFIRDVQSKSGTFLNTLRLSPSGQDSKPFKVNPWNYV